MPELPEVETVRRALIKNVKNKKILKLEVNYNVFLNKSLEDVIKNIANQTINDIKRKGKWLIFELDDYYLLSHLRMEGKYLYKDINEQLDKHEHVAFTLDNNKKLIYKDVRKFGKMELIPKPSLNTNNSLKKLGKDPWDKELTKEYLINKFKKLSIPIKTALLNQEIIAGIGNIYADEILFASKIKPTKKSKTLTPKECQNIIDNTKAILEKAIEYKGTTIRSYTSEENVHGSFQNFLKVHTKENTPCPICGNNIKKTKVNGRGTYYCDKCQK